MSQFVVWGRRSRAEAMRWAGPSLVVLALAMTVFETSMYLFVFLCVPSRLWRELS